MPDFKECVYWLYIHTYIQVTCRRKKVLFLLNFLLQECVGGTIPISLFQSSRILSLLEATATRVVLGALLVMAMLFLVMVCFEFPAVMIT